MHKYHVTSGMGGYLPNEVMPFVSLTAARAYARDLAFDYRENDSAVRGNMRDGYVWGHADAASPASRTGFFGYISVETCEWADCEVELDD